MARSSAQRKSVQGDDGGVTCNLKIESSQQAGALKGSRSDSGRWATVSTIRVPFFPGRNPGPIPRSNELSARSAHCHWRSKYSGVGLEASTSLERILNGRGASTL